LKTIMIVGAGKTQVPLIEAAKKEGYHTIVCDLNSDALGVVLADDYCRVSTKDRDGLYRTAQKKKIDGIVANSEYAMVDVAYIAEKLGLVGNPVEAVETLSSKSKFRALQNQIGLFSPKIIEIEGEKKILDHPVIIKPDQSAGSRGVTVADDIEKIQQAVQHCSWLSRNNKAIIEEFVLMTGRVVIEGEVFIDNGEILWDGLFSTIRSEQAPMVPMTYVYPIQEDKGKISAIKKTLTKVINAIGIVHGEYNIEMYYTNTNEPFIIEINPRQGGNGIPKYVQEHTGIDYYKLLVTTSMGDDYYWESLKNHDRQNRPIIHHLLFPRKTGRFRGLRIDDSLLGGVFNTEIDKSIGDEVINAVDATSCIGCVDLRFESVEQMNRVSLNLEKLIRIEIDED